MGSRQDVMRQVVAADAGFEHLTNNRQRPHLGESKFVDCSFGAGDLEGKDEGMCVGAAMPVKVR